ncbi:hypothetical protein [Micromonospora endophytica]|uniref:Uncharacterized protein n=1 Tax=Micromonospora endophytica TaxID=515350 RepID=A0A2W2DHL6_9ACTN|nr:hypothetical protein [Micromonospora endophytica]PZF96686.1 hypothetical protein C1I93_13480 [Micromonospora endophytica]RIW42537.1 hypothetical protein D3H59_22780 [Micromonospora endophytica]BCJ57460.1 hypothetical protein Jiend_08820 [Micromonospora endophytica]
MVEPILLDRRRPPATAPPSRLPAAPPPSRPPAAPPPLDWTTLADAFETACLLRCMPPPATPGPRHGGRQPGFPATVEFNREEAARRARQLLDRLGIPVRHELAVGGLRRRYELHRLHVPREFRPGYGAMMENGWRRGRRELLGGPVPGASTARRQWRTRLAAAAWRAALLAGGRHVRRHILGVRITDRELAAVLVRGAALLDVPALLRPGTGCYLVSVAHGRDRDRILRHAGEETTQRPVA